MSTHLGDGASHMSPLTLSPTSRCSRFSCLRSLQGNIFFLQEKLEHGVVLLDATGQTIDEILGKAANEKVKVLKPSSF